MRHEALLILPKIIKSVSTFNTVRSLTPSQLVETHGDYIRERVTKQEATPVLVCAHNEEAALPLLFYGLAQSTIPLRVIVVDNASTDRTTKVAEELGGTVISEEEKGLIHALRTGFSYFKTNKVDTFLHTDADGYPLPFWGKSMTRVSRRLFSPEKGGQLFAPLMFFGSAGRDIFRTGVALSLDAISFIKGKSRPHGANGVIQVDEKGQILESLTSPLSVVPVTGTDDFVHHCVMRAGGSEGCNFSPQAWMLSSGDRYPSIQQILRTFLHPENRMKIYQDWYQDQQGAHFIPEDKPTIGIY